MSESAGTYAIEVSGLVHRYGDVEAVAGIDLHVRSGECFGLLGPNGAGKTTTVEILEGLIEPTSGSVRLFGLRWADHARALRERIGIALQETRLPDRLTVRETITMFRSFYARHRDVDEVLKQVELVDKQNARYVQLSGGQKQRVAVACALIGSPELLFLDEPTTGLDPQSRRQLWDLVVEYRAGGATVILTTHYMDEAERLCDRVAVIDRGRIIALGTPNELIATLGGHEIVEVRADQEIAADDVLHLEGVHSARRVADRLSLNVGALHVALPALLAHFEAKGAVLTSLATHRATLEDVFIHLTGRELRE